MNLQTAIEAYTKLLESAVEPDGSMSFAPVRQIGGDLRAILNRYSEVDDA